MVAFSHCKTLLQGFLGGHEIAASTNGEGSGNFGMADQRLAMTWVQRHIEAFGGDGHAVTIFGESAGGNSIINHLAQPASFDLYARAISESGTYDVGAHSMAESEAGYRAVLALSNCSSLACLKGLDSDNVSALHHAMLFDGPTVDGVSLTDTPAALFAKGDYNTKAPVIIGSNRDESAFFTRIERVPPSMNESLFDFSLQQCSPIERAFGGSVSARCNTTAEQLAELKRAYGPGSGYPYPPKRGVYSSWCKIDLNLYIPSTSRLAACTPICC